MRRGEGERENDELEVEVGVRVAEGSKGLKNGSVGGGVWFRGFETAR